MSSQITNPSIAKPIGGFALAIEPSNGSKIPNYGGGGICLRVQRGNRRRSECSPVIAERPAPHLGTIPGALATQLTNPAQHGGNPCRYACPLPSRRLAQCDLYLLEQLVDLSGLIVLLSVVL